MLVGWREAAPGLRVFLGSTIVGHCTLDPVEADQNVLLLATGGRSPCSRTREPADGTKRYIQDVLADPDPSRWLGFDLDPDRTQVFLCGNPPMVGLPEWEDDQPTFPVEVGATQILHERGFTLDRKGHTGNVHFEAYW